MSIRWKKRLLWFLLAGGVGSVALIVSMCLVYEFFDSSMLLIVSVYAVVALVSFLLLCKQYEREPIEMVGKWQVSMLDLIVVMVSAAILMTFWQARWPESILPHGFAVTAECCVGLTFCLLLTERISGWSGPPKIVFAFGMWLRAIGYMGLSTALMFAALHVVLAVFGSPWLVGEFVLQFTGLDREIDRFDPRFINAMRAMSLCILPAYPLLFLGRKLASRVRVSRYDFEGSTDVER